MSDDLLATRRFRALTDEWTSEELGRFFWLAPEVIDTIGQKRVLILGCFTPKRKAILDALREKLRSLNFVPIVFDFGHPTTRDFTETIMTLAGLSCFIIADITNGRGSDIFAKVDEVILHKRKV